MLFTTALLKIRKTFFVQSLVFVYINKSGNYGVSEIRTITLTVCTLEILLDYDRRVSCHYRYVIMQYTDDTD